MKHKHPIPALAFDDRQGFIGTSGSGKTYSAGTAVELLLKQKKRVIIIDPMGGWWGLRLMADGKNPSPFNVVIFGGKHGDIPITDTSGAILGETAANMIESCIIDLSLFKTRAAERRFMTAFLETLYRSASGDDLFHLIIDEADLFAPQNPPKGDETLLGHMDNIVRRGRLKGFIPWLISQRPAVLHKNVLSQVDGLMAFKLTSPQDRKALDAWIKEQADEEKGEEIKTLLPKLDTGKGVVWLPSHDVLNVEAFPQKITFDSSRRPKRGEKTRRTAKLKPLNIVSLRERLSTVEKEAKENDPRALKAQIAELQRKLASPATKPLKPGELITTSEAIEKIKIAAHDTGYRSGQSFFLKAWNQSISDFHKAAVAGFKVLSERFNEEVEKLKKSVEAAKKASIVSKDSISEPHRNVSRHKVAEIQPPKTATPKNEPPASMVDASDIGAERKPLMTLAAIYPGGMTEPQWAVASGIKRRGSTFKAYKSRLKTAGRIERRDDGMWYVTETGMASLGHDIPRLPPPGPELVEHWISRISGVGPMLRHLQSIYPDSTTREDLAGALGIELGGSTFKAYLSRLRSSGLIEDLPDKDVRMSPSLMGH